MFRATSQQTCQEACVDFRILSFVVLLLLLLLLLSLLLLLLFVDLVVVVLAAAVVAVSVVVVAAAAAAAVVVAVVVVFPLLSRLRLRIKVSSQTAMPHSHEPSHPHAFATRFSTAFNLPLQPP